MGTRASPCSSITVAVRRVGWIPRSVAMERANGIESLLCSHSDCPPPVACKRACERLTRRRLIRRRPQLQFVLPRTLTSESGIEWVFRHQRAYLLGSQKPHSIVLKHSYRLSDVRVRIGNGFDISRNFHPLCRSAHLLKCVSEAAYL